MSFATPWVITEKKLASLVENGAAYPHTIAPRSAFDSSAARTVSFLIRKLTDIRSANQKFFLVGVDIQKLGAFPSDESHGVYEKDMEPTELNELFNDYVLPLHPDAQFSIVWLDKHRYVSVFMVVDSPERHAAVMMKRNALSAYTYVTVKGEGYFSLVKQYRSNETSELIALKELKEQYVENSTYRDRFLQEIRFLKELKHENIIEFLFPVDALQPAYAMPYADSNLDDFITRNNHSLPIEMRIQIFEQVLSAIHYSHVKDILHRDINPRNILIFNEEDQVIAKVSDFGLGKDFSEEIGLTHSNIGQYGQQFYVAPEQFVKLKDADERSDIYSLGKLLNFILTGKKPSIYHQCEMETVVKKATQENPKHRYQSVEDLIEDFKLNKEFVLTPNILTGAAYLRFVADNPSSINWKQFHRASTLAEVGNNVHNNYIYPIHTVLQEDGRLKDYVSTAGLDFEAFLKVFCERIDELTHTTGWTFARMDDYGELLRKIYLLTSSPNCKLYCMQQLWNCAYCFGQRKLCDIFITLVTDANFPQSIVNGLAMYIAKTSIQHRYESFTGIAFPPAIRVAIERAVTP